MTAMAGFKTKFQIAAFTGGARLLQVNRTMSKILDGGVCSVPGYSTATAFSWVIPRLPHPSPRGRPSGGIRWAGGCGEARRFGWQHGRAKPSLLPPCARGCCSPLPPSLGLEVKGFSPQKVMMLMRPKGPRVVKCGNTPRQGQNQSGEESNILPRLGEALHPGDVHGAPPEASSV